MELSPVTTELLVVVVASKDYKVKNDQWYCDKCEIYCNSDSQYDVHMISQKHKFVLDEESRKSKELETDENNNEVATNDQVTTEVVRARPNFSLAEISENPVALKFNINAVKYLIPNDKKLGKFEKFGFYCQTCDAYMTGQIQLVMHVRGAKHQYYFPSEIPNYTATKQYNPVQKKHSHQQNRHTITNIHNQPCQQQQQQQQHQQQILINNQQTQTHFYPPPPQQNHQFQNNNNNQSYQNNYNQLNSNYNHSFYQNEYQNLQQQFNQQQQMQFNNNNNNNNNNNPKNYNQQFQSPLIQFILPQNSTPPSSSSFCRTPIRKIMNNNNRDETPSSSLDNIAFATPGGYPYYPQHA